MEEQRQAAQTQQEVVWDSKTKRDVVSYVRDLTDDMRDYFSYAIEYANSQNNVSKEQFWSNLFYPDRDNPNEVILREKGDIKQDEPPENPYQDQDIQALWKYLRYGKNRRLPEGTEDDSKYYFKFFRLPRDKKLTGEMWYESKLRQAINIRNKKTAHVTKNVEDSVDWNWLKNAVEIFKRLTQCMERNDTWRPPQVEKVKDFWKRKDAEASDRFGSAPLSLMELGQILFSKTESLSNEEQAKLQKIARQLRLDERNGWVYGWSSQDELLDLMRLFLAKGEMTQEAARAVVEEQRQAKQEREEVMRQVEEQESQLTVPLWGPIPQKAARALRQAGSLLHMTETLWQAILDSFQVLVDESMFLAPEGREVLLGLQNVLAARHARLAVDASVVGTIFRQFRTSTPYTALELADMEPESREEMQKLRQEVHQEAKTAIKVLRHLREHSCLEVASSPTDSRNSYENIAWLARIYPKARFLVLTLDRQLAEELSQLKGRNAVAAKPDLEGNLLFFRSTRAIYTDMLRPAQEEPLPATPKPNAGTEASAPAQSQPEPGAAPSGGAAGGKQDAVLRVRRIPKEGEMVAAEYGDGSAENLRLGKFLNSGGEGSIYLTSRSDLVAKIYLEKHLTQSRLEKLRHMVAADPKINGLCWPCALLYNSFGEWIGFLMPKAEGKELATTVFTPGRGCCNIKNMGWSRRHLVSIAANIADLFSDMHRSGILMGDVNPRNFMVRPDCTVYFVDCDSYQFDGFSCPVFSPLFLPPEVHQRMRGAPGSGSSSFTRTQENELYSIAVLLFEVLFLGKAPYESRNGNNDDVIQAIIDGDFPYPFRGEDEDEDASRRSAMMAPVGRWRYIWSNLPYGVKEAFYDVFSKADKARPSASAWARTMRNYRELIEEEKSSDELLPAKFKVVTSQDGTEGTKMVDLVCEQCHEEFNQSEEVMEKRRQRGEKMLCDACRNRWLNFRKRAWTVRCDHCGREYESTVAAWVEHDEEGAPLYCPDCANETVTCSRCGRSYTEHREKVDRLREKNQELLCPDCFQKVFVQATCSACGAVYRDRAEMVERHRQAGRPLLCPKCRNRAGAPR